MDLGEVIGERDDKSNWLTVCLLLLMCYGVKIAQFNIVSYGVRPRHAHVHDFNLYIVVEKINGNVFTMQIYHTLYCALSMYSSWFCDTWLHVCHVITVLSAPTNGVTWFCHVIVVLGNNITIVPYMVQLLGSFVIQEEEPVWTLFIDWGSLCEISDFPVKLLYSLSHWRFI